MTTEGVRPTAIGQLLRALRLRAFPTHNLKFVAQTLKISANYLTKVETGYVKSPDFDTLTKMREKYKIHPYYDRVMRSLELKDGNFSIDKQIMYSNDDHIYSYSLPLLGLDPLDYRIQCDLPIKTIVTCYHSKPHSILNSLKHSNTLITSFPALTAFMYGPRRTEAEVEFLKATSDEWPQRLFLIDPRFKKASGYTYDISVVESLLLYDRMLSHIEFGPRKDFAIGPLSDYLKAHSLPPHLAKDWIGQLWEGIQLTLRTLDLSDPGGGRVRGAKAVADPHASPLQYWLREEESDENKPPPTP